VTVGLLHLIPLLFCSYSAARGRLGGLRSQAKLREIREREEARAAAMVNEGEGHD
jgi:hypothetical protein